jgi:TRAP-type C4-dicarboxylate transport system permease small subunit
MADLLSAYVRFTRAVNRVFLVAAGALTLAILAMVANDIVRRSVFDDPTIWGLDYSRFALVYLAFLALAPALQAGTHVNVDLVEQALAPGVRRVVRLVALALVVVFGSFLLWQVWRTTVEAFVDDALFPTMVSVKLKAVYWIGPVGMAQFILTGLARLVVEWRGGVADARDPAAAGA